MNGKHLRVTEERIPIGASPEPIWATLARPEGSIGIVIFAHGSGSSRFSPRNRFVADYLMRAGYTTVLADLLTESEEAIDAVTSAYRFDIALLAGRLTVVTRHVKALFDGIGEPIGYFGASTGAAAALISAADSSSAVCAVVSRGGRPDLAVEALAAVSAPTLLIVGGNDRPVIELNRQARAALQAPSELVIVPGAGHLFEEPGVLETVADLSVDWFGRHFRRAARRSA